MTYKITKNPDGTFNVDSENLTAKSVTSEQLWGILSSVDKNITLRGDQ